MSNYDNGFARAQREYDAQTPPESNLDTCPDCKGEGEINESNCCGADMDVDTGICLECKEHCEPIECETCQGTGEVEPTVDEGPDDNHEERIAEELSKEWSSNE